ncbi:MAG: O-methyltransferase [Bacteroidales bacterium]|nr:O-methyltransferase [Candidatus Cacconaster merdequi]
MTALEKYLSDFSTPLPDALHWLERETHLRTNHARMLCGPEVGALLHHFVLMNSPRRVLELGVFTGYSSICIATALDDGAVLDAVEINDELEDLIREGYARAGVTDKVNLIFSDAKEFFDGCRESYDLIYIDANKREYIAYYQSAIELLRPGGYIIADNVLWDGKVYEAEPPRDAQTRGIMAFNDLVAGDPRVENFILPLRDGLNIIRKK